MDLLGSLQTVSHVALVEAGLLAGLKNVGVFRGANMLTMCPVVLGTVDLLAGLHTVESVTLGVAYLLGGLRLLGLERSSQGDDLLLEKAQARREVEFKQKGWVSTPLGS